MSALRPKSWGITKPNAGASVDWGDPINVGLASLWLFNEKGGINANDLAPKKNIGTLNAGVKWIPGKFGSGLNFVAGSSQYISTPSVGFGNAYNPRGCTVGTWYRTTSNAFGQILGNFDSGVSGGSAGFRFVTTADGGFGFLYGNNTSNYIYVTAAASTLAVNTWYFITATWNGSVNTGSPGITLYVNGNAVAGTNGSTGSPTMANSTQALEIGRAKNSSTFTYLTADLDHVFYYNRALNPNEVKRLFTEPFAGVVSPKLRLRTVTQAPTGTGITLKSKPWGIIKPPAGASVNWGDSITMGTTGRWLFNDGAGLNASDLIAKNTGSLLGGVTQSIGKFGKALGFDGSTGYVRTIVARSNPPYPYSIAAWALTNSTATYQYIAGYFSSSSDNPHTGIIFNSTGKISAVFEPDAGGQLAASSTTTYAANTWYHVVGVFLSSTDRRIYVNGVLDGTDTTSAGTITTNRLSFGRFDRLSPATYLNGKINDVITYRRALNPSEIRRLYQEPFAGIVEPRLRLRSSPAAVAGSLIKTFVGLVYASTKTVNGLAIASVKSKNGLQ